MLLTLLDLQICFTGVAKPNMIKNKLRKFSGFDFEADSDEYTTKLEAVQKIDVAKLKGVCEGLTLDKKGITLSLSLLNCKPIDPMLFLQVIFLSQCFQLISLLYCLMWDIKNYRFYVITSLALQCG